MKRAQFVVFSFLLMTLPLTLFLLPLQPVAKAQDVDIMRGLRDIVIVAKADAGVRRVPDGTDAGTSKKRWPVSVINPVADSFVLAGGKTADGLARMIQVDDDGKVVCADPSPTSLLSAYSAGKEDAAKALADKDGLLMACNGQLSACEQRAMQRPTDWKAVSAALSFLFFGVTIGVGTGRKLEKALAHRDLPRKS
jgi:hypothetical protein